MGQLQRQGMDATLFEPGQRPPGVLVLGKRYDEASLAQARELRTRVGTRLVLDLCDDHFHAEGDEPRWRERADQLRRACEAVDRVVVASPTLGESVRRACGESTPITVIPDGLDLDVADPADRRRHDAIHALRLALFQRWHRVAPGRRLLWFGNHGASYAGSGMQDLSRIAQALAAHHRREPVSLLVVSNRWRTYREVSREWPWPSLYLPWSGANFARALRSVDIALIPVQSNPFTRCKTNNRLATAFINGLAVAADALPSYEEFRDLAVLDDWDAGLAQLMSDGENRARRIAAARDRLQARYAPAVVARRWADVLGELAAR
ncbi:hypothetical protein [Caldimonas sp. KR1-144]|uniref:hypothetical protein n=1 Tax=Caldimonas sp. KR1-144 TaxID=3400911 RepID=UPI003C0EE5D6